MELLAQIPVVGGTLAVVLPFLVVLTIVVFVHEFGHYIVGRWCGIKAEVFSVGFGKPLLKWTDRRGTRWQVAVLPLGGFVKFAGDMDPASAGRAEDEAMSAEERRTAFHNAGLIGRSLTVAAGPVANFLLSIVIFAGILMWVGQPTNDTVIGPIESAAARNVGFETGDRVLSIAGTEVETFTEIIQAMTSTNGELQSAMVERGGDIQQITLRDFDLPRVDTVAPGMPAARAGLLRDDVFVSIDGEPISTYRQVQVVTAKKPHGAEVTIEIDRGGERLVFRFVPDVVTRAHPVTGETVPLPTMGLSGLVLAGIQPRSEPVPVLKALGGGAVQTWRIISGTVGYIGDMLFEGADTSQLGGPIRIAEVSGDAAAQGFSSVIWLIAVLSTSIGLINLFPIPILDGGHLMFYAVEFVRGRPVGETSMKVGTMIGLSLVLLLMVFATYNDLVRL